MTETMRLGLPLIAPEQAQKHITHNEALARLDGIIQLHLTAIGESEPPENPEPGEAHAIGSNATGAWAGQDGAVAHWTQGGWRFASPKQGWLAWHGAGLVVFDDGEWRPAISQVAGLGIGTAHDATNRFAARSEAALFTAVPTGEGGNGNVRLTLNKESATDSATLIFQSGWSGRAEIGLAGDDNFAFKVSADGGSFATSMVFDAAHGFVRFEQMFGSAPGFPAIENGVLTVATSYAVPAPESGTTDEIDTINGGFDGALLVLTGTAGVALTFRDGAGNLKLGGDRVLDNFEDSLTLIRRGSDWIELSYADNG